MGLTYKDFCDPDDVEAYRRVKARAMKLAEVGREVAAEMVDGALSKHGKHFIETPNGAFRMSFGTNADNTTEQAAHERLHAQPVAMGERGELGRFFEIHGLDPRAATLQWLSRVKSALPT